MKKEHGRRTESLRGRPEIEKKKHRDDDNFLAMREEYSVEEK